MSQAKATESSPQRSDALRRGSFVTFAAAYTGSFLGDQVWFVTLGWAASQLGTARETALVMAVGSIPRAPLLLIGGVVADRSGPLRTSVTSQAARVILLAIGTLAIFVAAGSGLAVLVAVAFVFGVLDAIHTPALTAVPPSLLPPEDLTRAQGVLQGIQRLTMVLGAPAGGLAVAFGSVPLALGLVAALFAMSWFGLLHLSMRTDAPSAPGASGSNSFARDALDGMRVAATDPVILAILVVMTVLSFGLSGQLNVGIVLLSRENGWGPAGFAALLSSFAVGAALGAFAVATARRARRPIAAALIWVASGAASLAVLPYAPSLWVGCALVAAAGLAFGPASALLMGSLQARTPLTHIARVSALSTFASIGLTPVAYLAFGSVADTYSTTAAFGVFGGLVLTTCAVTASIRSVRSVSATR